MSEEKAPLALTLPSDLRFLSVARAFLEAVCVAGRFDYSFTEAVVVAMHEAISNVIRHAHRDRPNAQLQIRCYLRQDGMELEVLDEGVPFDLAAVPVLDPAELRIGGRGVFLMRTLMDELSCKPLGERGNLLRMVKNCRRNVRLHNCG
jgi:serine/threonine-protein kinase RsbW